MGIRFHCPNGHRLNVKSFLAGRRGYCPHCGVKLVIPRQSEAESSAPTNGTAANAVAVSPAVAAASSVEVSPAAGEIWYVRPPSGGQFGPATTDIVNQWVVERRVPPNSLIWREGWKDWKPAADLLTDNGRLPTGPQDAFDDVERLKLDVRPHVADSQVQPNIGELNAREYDVTEVAVATQTSSIVGVTRKRNQLRTKAAILLGILALLLLATLVWITTARS